MIKVIEYLFKLIVVFTIGTICLGLLEITSLLLWKAKFMDFANDLFDLLFNELKIKK